MKKLNVTKMHGCGNDFVIIDFQEFEKSGLNMSDLAKKICDRNFGVGADGMIIPKSESKNADISWYFYNSDGSTAQMCGNGMRCFAKYVYDKKIISKKEFSVETQAGIISPKISDDGNVRVNMGKPVLESLKIPFVGEHVLNQKVLVNEKKFEFNAVSMGNPHCVIFTDEDIVSLAKNYGPFFEVLNLFPEKTNTEFIKIKSESEMDLCVYERGCGITLACGTGACASVVAAILNNLTENVVKVNLPGGVVSVEWQGSMTNINEDVFLIGPAEYSFFAEFIL